MPCSRASSPVLIFLISRNDIALASASPPTPSSLSDSRCVVALLDCVHGDFRTLQPRPGIPAAARPERPAQRQAAIRPTADAGASDLRLCQRHLLVAADRTRDRDHDAFACAHFHGLATAESGIQRFRRFRLNASRSNRCAPRPVWPAARRSLAMPVRTWPEAQSRRPSSPSSRGASPIGVGAAARRAARVSQYSALWVVMRGAASSALAGPNAKSMTARAMMRSMKQTCTAWCLGRVGPL